MCKFFPHSTHCKRLIFHALKCEEVGTNNRSETDNCVWMELPNAIKSTAVIY